MSYERSLFRLHVVAESDPSALARVIERFQQLNIVPRRVLAELDDAGFLNICVDVEDLKLDAALFIAAKVGQMPCIVDSLLKPA